MAYRSSDIFVDSLDVTFSPDDCPLPEVNRLLLGAGFTPVRLSAEAKSDLYVSPSKRGTVKVDNRARFARISCSGAACGHLRDTGYWMDYLSILSSSPHTVTRLDTAIDLSIDGADLVHSMRSMHSSGSVSLGRKSIKTSVILSTRDDGRESGTWYAGYGSSAKATAKVYDKALQLLQRFGEVIPPRARVEVTAHKGFGATLRDAAVPEAIFWHIASPALLKAPEGVPMWQPDQDGGWQHTLRPSMPARILKDRVQSSAEIEKLIQLAKSFPGGLTYFRHLVNAQITAAEDIQTNAAV